ncbi:MAG: NAD(P)H-hydrate dehydratase [Gammaproteobacteria bacterium]|nr:NAD(P)H-hydrate dehydratase [Gammaproteobacteria bacterium]
MTLPSQLFSVEQVRAMDRYAIDDIGIPGIELMQRAGQFAFDVLMQGWPEALSIAVFCGAGNNGGDGYVIAHLALQKGLSVKLVALAEIDRLKGDALTAARQYLDAGGVINSIETCDWQDCDVLVDSLLGTGLDRDVGGAYRPVIEAINNSQIPVLAVDIPSGLHGDRGCVMGVAVRAQHTTTFIGMKQGLMTGDAADYCGAIHYHSLGVPDSVLHLNQPSAWCYVPPSPLLPARSATAHKGHFGHVLLIGGETGYSGAIRLAAQAALRCGAGLVSVATRVSHAGLVSLAQAEIMSHGIESTDELQQLLEKATVVVIGPGLGQSDWAEQHLDSVFNTDLPLVIDADALNLLSASSRVLHKRCVMTPHPGEAGRLLKTTGRAVQSDRYASVRQLQNTYHGVVVLKGAGTLVDDGELITVNSSGNPGMASGGMGDVLSGVIGGLLAQGLDAATAARCGVWLHGAAADYAARQGQRGLLAGDLLGFLRELVNQ